MKRIITGIIPKTHDTRDQVTKIGMHRGHCIDIRMNERTFGITTNRDLNTDPALIPIPAYRENIIQLVAKNHISAAAIGDTTHVSGFTRR
jgi:hypothetical protein